MFLAKYHTFITPVREVPKRRQGKSSAQISIKIIAFANKHSSFRVNLVITWYKNTNGGFIFFLFFGIFQICRSL